MLELRPICEHCACRLSPDSSTAMICSYECTFCRDCVDTVLQGVCPNCGGGFVARPVRPAREWVEGTGIAHHPPSAVPRHRPVDPEVHRVLLARLAGLPPAER